MSDTDKKIDELHDKVMNKVEVKVHKKSIPGLYYNYKKCSDEDIQKIFNEQGVKFVKLTHMGLGSVVGYYPMTDEAQVKMLEKPRKLSLTFDLTDLKKTPMNPFEERVKFNFLVKSTSRFFLKPDIGEVLDQVPFQELMSGTYRAIMVYEGYDTLPDTDGEHCIMWASLLY